MPATSTLDNDTFPNYGSFWPQGQPDHPLLLDRTSDWEGLFPAAMAPHGSTLEFNYDEDHFGLAGAVSTTDSDASQDRIIELIESVDPPAAADVQSNRAHRSQVPPLSPRRRPRRQNHSCDACRSGKKACDLSLTIQIHDERPSAPCSTCVVRGVDCTVAWLASRQSSRPARKRVRMDNRLQELDAQPEDFARYQPYEGEPAGAPLLDRPVTISSPECDLVRQLTARETCAQQLHLYVDIFDIPMATCLSYGCMPPCYSMGVAALAPLSDSAHFAGYMRQADSWTQNCWNMTTTPWNATSFVPHIFVTASVLDALFQQSASLPARAPTASRNLAISETYKWVAVATAAQFAVRKAPGRGEAMSPSQARDLAMTTWHKAKQMVFENMAVTSSFRFAMALLLFGLILPPNAEDQRGECQEDAVYAHCEGIRRLQALCSHARASLSVNGISSSWNRPRAGPEKASPARALPSEVKDHILELIGAVEWLVTMSNAAEIVLSRGRNSIAFPDYHRGPCPQIKVSLTNNVTPPTETETDRSVVAWQNDPRLEDSIMKRARSESQTVMSLHRGGIADKTVLLAINRAGALAVLLWKSLALFTLAVEHSQDDEASYEEIHRQYSTTWTLIEIWRRVFGRMDGTSAVHLQQSCLDIRRYVLFCSNDGDCGVLQFYEIVQRLEGHLADQPSTPAKDRLCTTLLSTRAMRREHRLASAMHVSYIATAHQGVSTAGFLGKSVLKSYVQDIAAHPHPALMVRAHALAAEGCADEIRSRITQMDTKSASEMTERLESCLQALQGLKETLVMFPDVQ